MIAFVQRRGFVRTHTSTPPTNEDKGSVAADRALVLWPKRRAIYVVASWLADAATVMYPLHRRAATSTRFALLAPLSSRRANPVAFALVDCNPSVFTSLRVVSLLAATG